MESQQLFRTMGRDVFGLDADGDGWGCDNR